MVIRPTPTGRGRRSLAALVIGAALLAACGSDAPSVASDPTDADRPASAGSDVSEASATEDTEAEPEEEYQIADFAEREPTPPRDEVAPGLVMVHRIRDVPVAVVFSIGLDGSVTENWRFDLAGREEGVSPVFDLGGGDPDSPRREFFSPDFDHLVATRREPRPAFGVIDRVGLFHHDGSFVDLSGVPDPAPEGADNQRTPRVDHDSGRFWYEQVPLRGSSEWRSMEIDGSDVRTEGDPFAPARGPRDHGLGYRPPDCSAEICLQDTLYDPDGDRLFYVERRSRLTSGDDDRDLIRIGYIERGSEEPVELALIAAGAHGMVDRILGLR